MRTEPRNDENIDVFIQTGNGAGTFPFKKTAKVKDVIDFAITQFDYAPGDRFELMLATDLASALNPSRTLVSYGFTDGTKVVLTGTGGGV